MVSKSLTLKNNKQKKILLILMIIFIMMFPFNVFALDKNYHTTYEVLEDGSYYETTIQEASINTYALSKSGAKTIKYKDSNGNECWYVKVTGNFTFNGSSAKCTSSVITTGVYNKNWKITNKSSSKSGASAKATATAKYYYNGSVVDTRTKTVTLTCSSNGVLS